MPSPLFLHTGAVLPEWIDYNGHLMDGYYLVAFTYPSNAFLDDLDLGAAYRERTGKTIYTVEGHINFLRELKVNAPLRYTTQLLGYNAKRIQVFHSLYHADEGYLAATNELMFLHVNQAMLKVEPMPPDALARLEAIYQAHRVLPVPPQVGRSVRLKT